MEISFSFSDGKASVVRAGQKKEIPKDALIEILHITLAHLAANRDYGNITSINKLLRTIDLECAPDDSDAEGEAEPVAKAAAPSAKAVEKAAEKPVEKVVEKVVEKAVEKAPVAAKKPAPAPAKILAKPLAAKPAAKEESESSESE